MHETTIQNDVSTEQLVELEPIVLAKVTEVTGTGGEDVEDDNVVWGNI